MISSTTRPFAAFLFFCIIHLQCPAQPVNILSDSAQQRLQHFWALPDSGYTFSRVLADSTLPFTPANKLKYDESGVYWIKIVVDNPSQYAGSYSLYTQPLFDNTVFYYDQNARKWIEHRTGALAPGKVRRYGIAPCILQGNTRNVIYVRASISALGKFGGFVNARFTLEKETVTRQQEQLNWIVCLGTILVVLLFLMYNGIVYFSIRDRAWLYYMLVQAGGILYIAGTFNLFVYLIPWRNVHPWLFPGGTVYYSHLNMFIWRMGTILILASYIQLTRSYLQTRATLPRMDRLLKTLLMVLVVFELGHNIITFSGLKFLDVIMIPYSNSFFVIILLTILVTAFAARSAGVYAAKYFLWANMGSLSMMIALALSYLFLPHGNRITWMPCAALMMQALMFAMALVARLRSVREELAEKHSEAEQLKTDIEQLGEKQQRLTGQHEQILAAIDHEKSRNEALEQQLAANQRELASATLYMTQKNELLTRLKGQVRDLGLLLPHGSKALQSIEANLQSSQFLDNDREKFRLHFEQVHPRFFENLKAKHPGLTQNEVRLCAYFHMNLSTKEIAGLLNIDPASVRRAKTRLNKKMNGALSGDKE